MQVNEWYFNLGRWNVKELGHFNANMGVCRVCERQKAPLTEC